MNQVRAYQDGDYEALISLYKKGELYGGQFDPARDSREKLASVTKADPQSILVYIENKRLLGSVSLIDNGRVAWLFRFAVLTSKIEYDIAQALYLKACDILSQRGHTQVLIYSDPDNAALNARYKELGLNEGNLYRCFWTELSDTSKA